MEKSAELNYRVELLIKGYKKEKIQNELNQNRDNPKKFWEGIREIWPKNNSTTVHSLVDEKSGKVYQDAGLADHINDYFTSIGPKLANVFKKDIEGNPPTFHTVSNNFQDNIVITPLLQDELLNVLNDIDISKSSSIHNIRSAVIVDAFRSQLIRVLRMYNGSLTPCTFPSAWKEGNIIPLPKFGNPKSASALLYCITSPAWENFRTHYQ